VEVETERESITDEVRIVPGRLRGGMKRAMLAWMRIMSLAGATLVNVDSRVLTAKGRDVYHWASLRRPRWLLLFEVDEPGQP
jgi:hypothetical protein